jgi:hypothetical protein
MAYCSNCGNEIKEGAKFCTVCGSPVEEQLQQGKAQRKQVFEGEIHKCPNCGNTLKSFHINCPQCGYEIRNTTNYIYEFSKKLEEANSVQKKDDLIRHFVIPNTKEDVFEFMILAASNIETGGENTEAWLVKLENTYQKGKYLLEDNADVKYITDIYNNAIKKYKRVKRNNKLTSLGLFWSTHRIETICLSLIFLSLILIFLGSVFNIGPIWNYNETVTSGHLWWKNKEVIPHYWPVLTVIGIAIAVPSVFALIYRGIYLINKRDKNE